MTENLKYKLLDERIDDLKREFKKALSKLDDVSTSSEKIKNLEKTVEKIDTGINQLRAYFETIKKELDDKLEKNHEEIKGNFVNNDRFNPIKAIVYGMVALILTAFVSALNGLIFLEKKKDDDRHVKSAYVQDRFIRLDEYTQTDNSNVNPRNLEKR